MNPAVTIKNEKTEKNEQTLIEKITRHISLSLDDPGDYQPWSYWEKPFLLRYG